MCAPGAGSVKETNEEPDNGTEERQTQGIELCIPSEAKGAEISSQKFKSILDHYSSE